VNLTQRVPRSRRVAMAMLATAGFATLLSACSGGDSDSTTPVTFAPASGPVGTVVSFTELIFRRPSR
jgi:recombinational DNA repair protein (RecF pathway)